MKFIYVIFLAGLLGCATPSKNESVLIIDQTEQRHSHNEKMLFSVFEDMDYGNITITCITDQSLTRSDVVYKEKSPPYLARVESEEQKKIANFEKDFIATLSLYNEPVQGLKQSYVYPVLASQCRKLALSNADQKSIIIMGDLLHNGEFSFYQYRKNPEKIMSRDYDLIVEKLEKRYSDIRDLDLHGITIMVVFLPSKENDRLFRASRDWWIKYLAEDKGAKIQFVTNFLNVPKLN